MFELHTRVFTVLTVWLSGSVIACSSDTGSEQPPPEAPRAVTYYEQLKPLIDEHCVSCHKQGGIAPFPLTTFEEVSARAVSIRAAVESRQMPPWLAGPDCADYKGDISLDDDEIASISDWVAAGSPAGDPNGAPLREAPAPIRLARVDLTLQLPTPFTPSISPTEYRCFVLDWTPQTTKFVTGIDVRPGDARIVHHALVYAIPPSQIDAVAAQDDADAGPGYACFSGPGAGGTPNQIGGWVPGSSASEYPAGTGLEVVPGSKIVLQVHYETETTPPAPDATIVDLTLEDSVTTKAAFVTFLDPAWPSQHTMNIPARTADAVQQYSADPHQIFNFLSGGLIEMNRPITLHFVAPHMHTRGTKQAVALQHADGSRECMIDIPRWDFHWQRIYDFASPKILQPGETMSIECHWNNDSDAEMNWGEGTDQEMCMTGVYVTQ